MCTMMHCDAIRSAVMNQSARQTNRKAHRITVSLSERDHAALVELAAKHDVSISWLARRAVSEFISNNEHGQTQLPLHINR